MNKELVKTKLRKIQEYLSEIEGEVGTHIWRSMG